MKKLMYGLLSLFAIASFQNCSGSRFDSAATSSLDKINANDVHDVLGLYDSSEIRTLKFRTMGGLLPGPRPELTVLFGEDGHLEAFVTLGSSDYGLYCIPAGPGLGSLCSVGLDITETMKGQFLSALTSAKLETAVVDTGGGIVLDCGYETLEIGLKNMTTHSYTFNAGNCSPNGALVINSNALEEILGSWAQQGYEMLPINDTFAGN